MDALSAPGCSGGVSHPLPSFREIRGNRYRDHFRSHASAGLSEFLYCRHSNFCGLLGHPELAFEKGQGIALADVAFAFALRSNDAGSPLIGRVCREASS